MKIEQLIFLSKGKLIMHCREDVLREEEKK